MAVVVSDTSPVWALSYLQRLDLLRDLFGEVLIPPASPEGNQLLHFILDPRRGITSGGRMAVAARSPDCRNGFENKDLAPDYSG